MAIFSLRISDDLKQTAQQLAKAQDVSLNFFINAVLTAAVAQHEALTFYNTRLQDVDQDLLCERVLRFMR